jgi:hypothetical protein
MEEDTSHPISFLGEHPDDELPILLAASPHLRVRMNNRTDVLHDVFHLSALVMQGHPE